MQSKGLDAQAYGPLKILVVEDNHHMRTIIGSILQSVGIKQVLEVSDGQQALDAIGHYDPDIILVDYQMSSMDGVAFTRHVRQATARPYIPIIMITGHSQRSKVEAARDAGITEFVAKPLTARALLSRINAVVQTPRPFIRCATYFGPDRRRKGQSSYTGPLRRAVDRNEVAI